MAPGKSTTQPRNSAECEEHEYKLLAARPAITAKDFEKIDLCSKALGLVHSAPETFKNAALFLQLDLPSTENALQTEGG